MGKEARAATRPSVPWFFVLSNLAKQEAAATEAGDFKRAAQIRRKREALAAFDSDVAEAQAAWQSRAGRLVTRGEIASLLGRSLWTIERQLNRLELQNVIRPIEAGAGRRPNLYERNQVIPALASVLKDPNPRKVSATKPLKNKPKTRCSV